eukprot:TRINITY_DN3807_c0_g2_i1.p1 TRINITY_DN3807_c0_g2~~TRINITY_DN3807_c0_g2_i1.p1  ORF type:complete len:910 (-),score=217.61 TRINITY_DN3807_c0_g2_i1:623-3352(-)
MAVSVAQKAANFDLYQSLAAGTGEWKTRKINLFQVLKGFVSQLKLGQDLTKVSLPAELCHPYTMLEIIALRQIITYRHLFEANNATNDLDRFMRVLRWFLGTIQQESFEKKPFNPVLGENHICWVANSDNSITEFIGEQVSHHPPVSAYRVRNEPQGVELSGTISFGVRFGKNYVSVTTAGAQFITLEKFGNEKYEFAPKCLPDMVVRNVVIGSKYIMWEGEITVSCPSTGYSATIQFSEKSKQNLVKATVTHVDSAEPIYEIHGTCGGAIHYQQPLQPNTKQLLIDASQEAPDPIFFLPKEHQDPLASVQCWRKVYQAIINNDMPVADKEKKIVEQDQRDRSKQREQAGLLDRGMFFAKNAEDTWEFNSSHSVLSYLQNPNEYAWPRSSGPGVPPPTPKEASTSSSSSSTAQLSTPATAESISPRDKTPSKKDRDESQSSKASRKKRPTTDDDVPPSSSKSSLAPSPDALQHSYSDSEAQNIHSDDDEQLPRPPPEVVPVSDVVESSDSLRSRRLSVNVSGSSVVAPAASPTAPPQGHSALHMSIGAPASAPATPSKHLSSRELKQEKKKVREEQKIVYAKVKLEKKRNSELLAQSSSQTTIATGFMKIRNSLKKWQTRYVVLQPGRFIYFRGQQEVEKDTCSGILFLSGCEVRKRPSKKDGFCFKIFHLAQYPIYSKQGLKGETLKKALLPVGADYCIMRVNDEQDRNRWIDAIRQAIPDYDKVKQLAAVVDDSDSDDSDGDDEEDEPTMTAESSVVVSDPSGQPIADSSTSTVVQARKVPREAALEIGDLAKQMGQLYTKQRRMGSHIKENNSAIEELKKQHQERVAALEKTMQDRIAAMEKTILFQVKQMAQQQQQRAAQMEKEAKQNSGVGGVVNRLKSDPLLALQMVLSLLIVYALLSVTLRG